MNSEENNHQESGDAAKEEIKLPTTLAEFLDLEKLVRIFIMSSSKYIKYTCYRKKQCIYHFIKLV